MTDSPLVGVVIPLYNKQGTVARAIRSVLDQTVTRIEVVVVNDGSTDSSLIAAEEACASDPRAKVVSIPNGGVAVARTTGVLQHTTAPYIVCLDADDAIQPRFLEVLLPHLHIDKTLGIVYTTLVQVHQNGKTSVSPWPSEFDAEKQFFSQNQVPTACLMRREIWERLGGQRSRYAPLGAGSEDADFWLRACAYGFGVKFVPAERDSAFLYTVFGGTVSGNKEYREVNWKAWHPWTRDRSLMPFFSIAPPDRMSHPGRYYSSPGVSIIVPVGPGHIRQLANCLDSIDAQTYRNVEGVVVFDVGEEEWRANESEIQFVLNTWPHLRYATTLNSESPVLFEDRYDSLRSFTDPSFRSVSCLEPPPKPRGASVARNIGIKLARATRLVFLDADDWITPDAIGKMLVANVETGNIIYTDHVMVANVKQEDLHLIDGVVQEYDSARGLAYIWQSVAEYNCELAMRQPDSSDRPYVICNITAMVPKEWALEVGGFDEDMPAWEDVLFFLKLAWTGRCFTRIAEPLLAYRYHAGARREEGHRRRAELMNRLREASIAWRAKKVGCGCAGGSSISNMTMAGPSAVVSSATKGAGEMVRVHAYPRGFIDVRDTDLVEIEFRPHKRGDMDRYGTHDFGGGKTMRYQRRSGGERFYVHVLDIEEDANISKRMGLQPQYLPIKSFNDLAQGDSAPPLPAPDVVVDLESIANVPPTLDEYGWDTGDNVPLSDFNFGPFSVKYLNALKEAGINTVGDLRAYEAEHADGISGLKGMGARTRKTILAAVGLRDG